MSAKQTANERLYYDADRSPTLVVEGDPAATILAAAVGDEIPEGFKAPTAKQSSKPADKQVSPPTNKGS